MINCKNIQVFITNETNIEGVVVVEGWWWGKGGGLVQFISLWSVLYQGGIVLHLCAGVRSYYFFVILYVSFKLNYHAV